MAPASRVHPIPVPSEVVEAASVVEAVVAAFVPAVLVEEALALVACFGCVGAGG